MYKIFKKNKVIKIVLIILIPVIAIISNIITKYIFNIEFMTKGSIYAISFMDIPAAILIWIFSLDCNDKHKKLKLFLRIYAIVGFIMSLLLLFVFVNL